MTRITATNSEGYDSPIGIAADAVILTLKDDRLCVLLARREEDPARGVLALPGGFMAQDELPEETAARKVEEKTGLAPGYLEQLRFYYRPGRDSRGWLPSMAYLALVPADQLPAETEQVQWVPVDEVLARHQLPFDHGQMVQDAVERLQGKLWYSNIAMGLLPAEFTLSQARKVYEAISGQKYDPANFRRELSNRKLVRSTGRTVSGGPGRPAETWEWVSRDLAWVPSNSPGSRSRSKD